MSSTIVDIIFLVAGISIVVIGVIRGFLGTVIHLLKYILAFVLAYFFGGLLADLLGEFIFSSPVKSFVYDSLYSVYSESPALFDVSHAIDALPSFLVGDSVREGLDAAQGTGEVLLQNMTDAVATPIISVVSNIFGYALSFLLALVGLWIAAVILTKLIDKIQLLGRLNRLLGFALGLVMSLLLLFAVSSIIRFFWGTTEFYHNTVIVRFFGDSSLLRLLAFLDIGRAWWTS